MEEWNSLERDVCRFRVHRESTYDPGAAQAKHTLHFSYVAELPLDMSG